MAIQTINQLIKTNAFINLDGSIECIDAFVEMMAYYYGVRDYTAKTAEEKKACDDAIVELSMMASANGFRPAEARREARALVKRTMVRIDAKRLLKAA